MIVLLLIMVKLLFELKTKTMKTYFFCTCSLLTTSLWGQIKYDKNREFNDLNEKTQNVSID
jgi:hypothetical protein